MVCEKVSRNIYPESFDSNPNLVLKLFKIDFPIPVIMATGDSVFVDVDFGRYLEVRLKEKYYGKRI